MFLGKSDIIRLIRGYGKNNDQADYHKWRAVLGIVLLITAYGLVIYSTFTLSGGMQEVVSMQLGLVEELLGKQLNSEAKNFVRIGRSWIVNREKVYKIVPGEGVLMLRDGDSKPFKTTQISVEALKKLKAVIERNE